MAGDSPDWVECAIMSTIHVEALVNREELLKAIAQLDLAAFEQFVSDILTLRAQRTTTRLPAGEAALLQRISQGLPDDLRARVRQSWFRNDAIGP